MIPKPPPQEGGLGFLYIPPYRVQGYSVAGEVTTVQVPELDITFDMGACPRSALASKYVAISHGHMDHVGGLAYYASQRKFQGMTTATIICHKDLETPIRNMMDGFSALEGQKTPYELVAMEPEGELEIKNSIYLRMFEVAHTTTAAGYVIVEKRSKLKEEYASYPQEKLRELKDEGKEITRIIEVPLVAYLGDTAPCPGLIRRDVLGAQVVICECTFIDPGHKSRADIGKHLHLDNIVEWLPMLQGEKLVLIHLSRRSNIQAARKRLKQLLKRSDAERVEFLMDHRTNKMRYQKQAEEAERIEAKRLSAAKSSPVRAEDGA